MVQNNAEINAKTNELQSPLHFASSEGHQEVVKLLLENGATHEIKDINDFEPDYVITDANMSDPTVTKSIYELGLLSNGNTYLIREIHQNMQYLIPH